MVPHEVPVANDTRQATPNRSTGSQSGTTVRMELTYELQPDVPGEQEIEAQMGQLVGGTLAGLKHYAETGERVEPQA